MCVWAVNMDVCVSEGERARVCLGCECRCEGLGGNACVCVGEGERGACAPLQTDTRSFRGASRAPRQHTSEVMCGDMM